VRKIVAEEPVDEIDDLPAGSYCIVMTHNHQLDLELTAAPQAQRLRLLRPDRLEDQTRQIRTSPA
jgi:xanthine/CO dehydrogenase XdhC/CoxF family maturation factor